jgi:hypothetical protein
MRYPFLLITVCVLASFDADAQADLPIFTDRLVNGFDNWSWAPNNDSNGSVHSGTNAMMVTVNGDWQGISFHHSDFDTSPYSNFVFWANGGSAGGQVLRAYAQYGPAGTGPTYDLSPLAVNTWQKFVVPLSVLGVENRSDLNRLTLQVTSFGTTGSFYLDDISLSAKPAPGLIHLNVQAASPIRVVDARFFGFNTAIWDDNFDTPTTASLFHEMGAAVLRFPGGSLSDEYHWASNKTLNNTWTWATSFGNFVHVATNVGVQAFITVNYGTGTPAEAAGWVKHSNVTNHYALKYWEIGNECYGTWETDTNNQPHDAYTYALRATNYFRQMRTADPTIKIGIVVAPGEENFVNGNITHSATNLRNGELHYGWTPVLLSTLKAAGVMPDFAVHHRYPQYTGTGSHAADSDALLLQSTSAWAADAADLRQQISDYFGPQGTNIELVCTENNSDAGPPGRQSTSLVNGLYYAESLAQIMKTEFNALVWWDFRNGTDTTGNFDPTVYGWRNNGDLGMIGGLATKYPPFYAAKLMQYFARSGDAILTASSDYLLLQSYAARTPNGALALLVVNRDTVANLHAEVALQNFVPQSTALVRSFGIPQDEAARTNGTAQARDIATNLFSSAAATFNYDFAPLSLTIFNLPPAAPTLQLISPPNNLVLKIEGQQSTRYVLQASGDLSSWTNVSTNTLISPSLYVTNPATAGVTSQFFRLLWEPDSR